MMLIPPITASPWVTETFPEAAQTEPINGWYAIDWWGDVWSGSEIEQGWLYHLHHGWQFVQGQSGIGLWSYDLSTHWNWFTKETYPFIYMSQHNQWAWYMSPSQNPRLYYLAEGNKWTGDIATYSNPFAGLVMGDPFVIKVDDTYYLTGTTSSSQGFHAWTRIQK